MSDFSAADFLHAKRVSTFAKTMILRTFICLYYGVTSSKIVHVMHCHVIIAYSMHELLW